jgi:hypothetical protein
MLPVLRGSESSGASGRKTERTWTINAEEMARREAEIVLAWNGGSETTAKLPWGRRRRRRRRRAANRAMAKLPWT